MTQLEEKITLALEEVQYLKRVFNDAVKYCLSDRMAGWAAVWELKKELEQKQSELYNMTKELVENAA